MLLAHIDSWTMFTSGGLLAIAMLLWFSGYLRGKEDGNEVVVERDGGDFIASPSLHSNFLLLLMAAENPILFPDITELYEKVGDQLRNETSEKTGENFRFNNWMRNTHADMYSLVTARKGVIFLKQLHEAMRLVADQETPMTASKRQMLRDTIKVECDPDRVNAIGAARFAYIWITLPIISNAWTEKEVGMSRDWLTRLLREIVGFADIIDKKARAEQATMRAELAEEARGLSKRLGVEIAQPFDDVPIKDGNEGAQPVSASVN